MPHLERLVGRLLHARRAADDAHLHQDLRQSRCGSATTSMGRRNHSSMMTYAATFAANKCFAMASCNNSAMSSWPPRGTETVNTPLSFANPDRIHNKS